jgi:transmembrane sensor
LLEETIDELIIRSIQGEATFAEQRRLGDWISASPENAARYAETVRLLELADPLRLTPALEAAPTIEELVERQRAAPARPRNSPISRRFIPALSLGAPIAALLLFAFFFGTRNRDQAVPPHLTMAQFVTGAGETVTAMLGDGTVVRLGPRSRLRVEDSAGSREVWLDGRAYFAVTEHPDMPFRVRTRAGEAHVLGTRFDLEVQDEALQVTVVEGRVELAAAGPAIDVSANERARVQGDATPTRESIGPADLHRSLGWMGDFLVFEGTPLAQAAIELGFHYGIPVEVMDSVMGQETVHGWFADEELDDVLSILCRAVRARCTITPDRVTIEP